MKKTNAEARVGMNKKLVIIVIAVIVVLGGASAYLLTQKNASDNKSDDTTKTSDTADSDAKKYNDACKIFTKEEIAAALGGTYGDGEEEYAPSTASPGSDNYEDLKGSACNFKQDNDGSTAGMTAALDLSVAINNYASAADAKTFMNDLRHPQTTEAQEAVGQATDVDGVGDQAFFPVIKTAEGTYEKTEALYVLVGRQVIVLTTTQLDGVDRDAVRSSLTTLAKKL